MAMHRDEQLLDENGKPIDPHGRESSGRVDPWNNFMADSTYTDPQEDESAPEELLNFFEVEQIAEKAYRCTVRQLDVAQSHGEYLESFSGVYPSREYITNHYGPGKYQLTFMWRGKTNDKRYRSQVVEIAISPKMRDQYNEFQYRKNIERAKARREEAERLMVESKMGFDIDDLYKEKKDEKKALTAQVKEIAEMAGLLGFKSGDNGFNLKELLPLVPPVLGFLQTQRDQADKRHQEMMMMMLKMSSGANSQLVEMMKAQNPGGQSATQMIEENMSLMSRMIDFKKAVEPQESLSDKLFKLAEGAAPMIVALLNQPRQQRMSNPMVGMAQHAVSEDMAELKQNPEELIAWINNMDQKFGWEQTDIILETMSKGELARPLDRCPRIPELRMPESERAEEAPEDMRPEAESPMADEG